LADQDLVASAPTGPVEILSIPVRADGRGRQVGTLAAGVRLDALAPRSTFETRFGRGGYTVLAGRISNTMYDPLSPTSPRGAVALTASPQRQTSAGGTAPLLRTVRFTERDTARVATVGAVPSAPFAVISSGAIDEYGRSFAQVRLTNLLLALALTVVLIVAFVIVTRRATRPLETLTAAAAEVGRGNFRPSLPPSGRDEVGRLSAAFAAMSGHIDRMMRELESSRQMVAVGSFARQIAHEIRNPLTSIKLNLQSLERDARDGLIASDRRRTVEICLEEIQRLDRVVRGVLRLGRAPSDGRRPISIGTVVERALAVMRPQFEQQRVAITYEAPRDDMPVTADEEQLVGIFLNLFANAAEAMPNGGSLNVAIDGLDNGVRVIVRDSGPGVPPDARARIFEPFFTTKREGSGLGLAIAMRDAERYRGRISVADSNAREAGATFIVELPLTPADNA
jgi:signal transduction histidine kinase